uniref:Uncharacterized protein n=2 Tax=viral metagenome TaxID=1070528 RepID=A0A6M3KBE5_9ZZZZ
MKRLTCFLLICAVIGAVLGMGAGSSICPYMTVYIRTLLDDATQGAAQTTLGLGTGDSPTFAGLTTTGNSIFGLNSSVLQPTTDSTTFFQVKDQDGNVIGNFDTVNNRLGIQTDAPLAPVHIKLGTGQSVPTVKDLLVIENNGDAFVNFIGLSGNTTQGFIFSDNVRSIGNIGYQHSTGTFFMTAGGTRTFNLNAGGVGEFLGLDPSLTIHNETHEDTDGGRESELNFKGEQSGGEETTLARIEVSHDGAADDEKGQEKGFINDGDDGDSPTQVREWDSIGLEFVNSTIIYDVNNISADIVTFNTYGLHIIDSSGAGITGTLAAGTKTGQSVKFVCKTSGNDIDITVSNHVTSDPEVIRLDTAKEWLELVWDGTDWVEVDGNGQSYP